MRKHQLDGLRFMLFLMVFATHYAPNPVQVGYLGYALPVFFVMSGFLITKVLLSTDHPRLSTRLKVFYFRRILRICPAYYLTVLVLMAMGTLSFPLSYLGYLVNIKLYALSLQPAAEFHQWFAQSWRAESLHLWSLSVEEQFYVVYPLILYLTAPRYRTAVLFGLLLASIAVRLWFIRYHPSSFFGTLLPVSAEYFLWGCIFSWLEHTKRLGRLAPDLTLSVSAIGLVALIAGEYYLGQNGFLQFSVSHYQTPVALAMGFFIWGLWSLPDSHTVVRVLSWPPLVYFGGMSYTLYLVHLIAAELYRRTGLDLPFSPFVDSVIGGFITSLLMAMAIWHGFEHPIYALRRYLPYEERRR